MSTWQQVSSLISSAKRGDHKAFDRLVGEYGDRLGAHIRVRAGRQLRQRYDVDDLRQETFLRAFQSIRRFRGESLGTFWKWLVVIAEHVIQDHGRRLAAGGGLARKEVSLEQKRPGGQGDSWTLESLLEAGSHSPSRGLRRDERFDRLKSVLGSLPPDYARVILLARVECLPMKDVAKRMKRSPEAASMLLLRALLKLKSAFGDTDSLHLPARSLEEEGNDHGH
jgi:RNA polymerase sigma-70 factor (ECF subfamily)